MRLTGLGKFVIFILVLGIGFGAYNFLQQSRGTTPGGSAGTGSSGTTPGGGFKLPSIKLPGGLGGSGAGSGPGTPTRADNEIEFMVTAAKKDWVQDQIDRFNEIHGGKWKIVATPMPSREAMHAILKGKARPVLWSPGSPIWPTRLSEAWAEQHGGSTILDMTDPNAYRVFLKSPLVFLTTKQKAPFLRPILGGQNPWRDLRALSLGQKRAPWGSFRFSHADPLTSSSGMLTLGLILLDYAQQSGGSGDLTALSNSANFRTYIKELERGLIYDEPAEKGTTALTKAFLADLSHYDFITAYESAALEAAPKTPNLAVIYPNPTAVSEHAVSLLNGDWVTKNQRAGALEFLKFLSSRESLQSGLKYKFRPVQSAGGLSLAAELNRYAAQGFKPSFNQTDLPPYQALNSAAYQWRIHVVKKPPTDDD